MSHSQAWLKVTHQMLCYKRWSWIMLESRACCDNRRTKVTECVLINILLLILKIKPPLYETIKHITISSTLMIQSVLLTVSAPWAAQELFFWKSSVKLFMAWTWIKFISLWGEPWGCLSKVHLVLWLLSCSCHCLAAVWYWCLDLSGCAHWRVAVQSWNTKLMH